MIPIPEAERKDDDDADLEELAALEFEAWDPAKDIGFAPPVAGQWVPLFQSYGRWSLLSWHLLFKSKEELIALAEKEGSDMLRALIVSIDEAQGWFEANQAILDCAHSRLVSASAVLALRSKS